ncbi:MULTISPECIES: hypothetical protein [Klebsiella pneumoniae complex]|uniref:hypothetical protein n=1 Tax=Klebsiella pneumoniae complex TaxID=3390273 RepID=UPI001CBB9CAF|nr:MULTISPECIES: hypothetical protein [Klebsiella]EME9710175.1 hypothetical protein [Klebsiella pneumoniae]MBZ1551917.1 hypothetical protein [Klebsiella pneumoniae]MCM2384495.1 hypothetical protein [Klebsiella pneumoniae]
MNNDGLTLNQLAERNAVLVTEVEKLRAERDQLAAENVEAKKIISECREYFIAGVMNRIRPTNEGYLHMICDTFADETPATDRIVSGIKADGVEEFAAYQRSITEEWACKEGHSSLLKVAESAELFAQQLREGADK